MEKKETTPKRTVADYYREEWNYLMTRGKAFAREFGKLMQFFQDDNRNRDPHVDRVLEGVAFLNARLHKAFDENKGHLAFQFLRVFWPQFLRPIPSLSMIEFKPRSSLTVPILVEKEHMLESRSFTRKDQDSTSLFQVKYSISESVTVNPMTIESVTTERIQEGLFLKIRIALVRGAFIGKLDLENPIRVQLIVLDDYELYNAYEDIRYNCSEHHNDVVIRLPGSNETLPFKAAITFPDPLFMAPLLPDLKNVFPGFRMLQEFFLLPQRFMVFDIQGLKPLAEKKDETGFELLIQFNKNCKNKRDWQTKDMRLHCVPAVNLFTGSCRTQTYSGETRRLILEAGGQNAEGCSIYSLQEVTLRHFGDRKQYTLKESDFSIYGDHTAHEEQFSPSYSLDYEFTGAANSGSEKQETASGSASNRKMYIIVRDVPPPASISDSYSVSVEASWCNHDIAPILKQIQITQGAPEPVQCENLMTPTRFIAPREPSFWHWRLVDLMSLNYTSIQTIEGFRSMLEIFMTDTSQENKVFVNSLLKLTVETKPFWEERVPVNGLLFTFHVADHLYQGCRGKLFAFFDILYSFLRHYVSINSKIEIQVILHSTNEPLNFWKARSGSRIVL